MADGPFGEGPMPPTPMGTDCVVHKHRSSVPVVQHHVWPVGLGGPSKAFNKVRVCENGHYEVHNYFDLLMKYDPDKTGADNVPWLKGVWYGKRVKALAQLGYSRYCRNAM
jgi:hypothetical protein